MKGTDESVTRVDSSIHLMYHDLSDLGSLIQINLKERTLSYIVYQTDPQKQKKKERTQTFSEHLVLSMTMPFSIPL